MNPAVHSISAFFPCYNDEATIASMVNLAFATIDGVGAEGDVTVVNDGSTDGSAGVLAELQAAEPRLRVVTHPENRGYGGALLSGFEAATKQWAFYTDGDAQFDPSELAQLVEAATPKVDVVQGYKLRRADNLMRRVIGRVYHRFVAFMFGLKIRDTDCDFRLIRKDALDRIELVHTTGVICVELVRKLQDSGARFVEVPVHHYPRTHGQSQFFNFSSVVRSLRDLAGLWFRLVVFRRGERRVDTTSATAPSAGSSSAGARREDEHGATERHRATS
jgi:glycosyltransferase involved in cell wall biosynthesis